MVCNRIAAGLIAALATIAPPAQAGPSQLAQSVARELPGYGFDVDVASLSSSQVATIYHVMNSRRSHGDKRGLIQSTLGGPNTLRGLIFSR